MSAADVGVWMLVGPLLALLALLAVGWVYIVRELWEDGLHGASVALAVLPPWVSVAVLLIGGGA